MTAVAERLAPPAEHKPRSLGYAVGLDGLRAIAVTAVLLFHGDVDWFQGGFLGVDVFFVLSGFLITSLLLRELRLTDRIDFTSFYLRRARRLLPALILTLLGAAVLAVTVAPDAAERLRGDIVASLFYVTNWWYVLHDLSYFEAIGRAPLLQHLWTLAIEEQFYLVWPAVAFALFRWGGRLRVASVALLGALASTAWMTYLSVSMDAPGAHDVSRFYFGTDSHAMGLLLGAAFAAVWQMDRLQAQIDRAARRTLTAAGLVGLLGIVWFVHAVDYQTTWLYRGGFLALSVSVVLVIAAAVHPALRFGAVLGWGPMRYIGTRSYGLYLFHWPIFMVLRPEIDVPWGGFPVLVLRLVATFAVAELSYRFVEMPVRSGVLGRLWRAWREQYGARFWAGAAAGVLTLGLVVGTLSAALSAAPSASAIDGLDRTSTAAADDDLSTEPLQPQPSAHPDASPGAKPGESAKPGTTTKPSDGATPSRPSSSAPATTDLTLGPITAVGDSVMLGDSTYLEAVFPKITVDAAVGRQSGAVFARIRQRLAADRLAPTVIIHTGTNGVVVPSDLDATLDKIGPDRVVVLVNTHVPRKWQDSNNEILAAAAAKYPNVRLVDWAALSAGHRGYFVSDGVHMNRTGGQVFTMAIAKALGGDPKRVSAALADAF